MTIKALTIGLAAATLFAGVAQAQTLRIGNTDADIERALRGYGYEAFRITDREIVRTVVEACRGRDKYRVSINVLGAVKTKERLGRCDIGTQAAQRPREERRPRETRRPHEDRAEPNFQRLRARLRDEGYRQIEFTDRRPPRFAAVACTPNGRKFALSIARNGDIRNRTPIGRCERRELKPALTAEGLTKTLREEGYKRVAVTKEGNRLRAEACLAGAKLRLTFGLRGGQASRERIGNCESRTVSNVVQRLQTRGARKTEVFVEGCFQKVKYRWSFDDLGDRTARRKIGTC